jgi:hypothetical protein
MSSLPPQSSVSPATDEDPSLKAPAAVRAFLLAIADRQLESLLRSFAPDARVNDQLREYSGSEQIRAWAITDLLDAGLSLEVMAIDNNYDCSVVTADVDGNFDKRGLPDPLVHKFYFTVAGEKIVQLIVLRDEG